MFCVSLYWQRKLQDSEKMYGMLLESIQHFIQKENGEEVWLAIRAEASCEFSVFNTFQIYPDHVIGDLARAASKVLGNNGVDWYMKHFGRCFVKFFSNFGYEEVIKATGGNFTEFLENIDNIHAQMQFTYTRMDSPSIYVTDVDPKGCVLMYKSSRSGLKEYFHGQLLEVADSLFGIQLDVNFLEEVVISTPTRGVQLKLRLNYDNLNYISGREEEFGVGWAELPPLTTSFLVELFPFTVLFGPALRVLDLGDKVRKLFPGRRHVSTKIADLFAIRRPKGFHLTWKNVVSCQSVSFELEILGSSCVTKASRNILLTGQMKLLEPISVVIFLCSPAARNVTDLQEMGLYFNDLNDIGLGCDLVVKGLEHTKRLEEMKEKCGKQCQELEENYNKMKEWKEKGDKLLYSMIPRTVADKLKAGLSPLETCKDFEQVTIMFAEVCGLKFTDTMEEVMQVVEGMNSLFTKFDKITDEYQVYKVETVGEIYMAVSGAPESVSDHAEHVANLSLRLVREIEAEPSAIQIRIGAHSGEVVAGVVGTKLPRYCLFGDTVNTASRMQSTSLAGRIQISSTTKKLLNDKKFVMESRGIIQVKGKGEMETYWLAGIKNVI